MYLIFIYLKLNTNLSIITFNTTKINPMGAKFVKIDNNTAPCTSDADCYKENLTYVLGGYLEATTDAEKKKRCCLKIEVTKAGSGASAEAKQIGWPTEVDTYTK
jgi:hypothetical protein